MVPLVREGPQGPADLLGPAAPDRQLDLNRPSGQTLLVLLSVLARLLDLSVRQALSVQFGLLFLVLLGVLVILVRQLDLDLPFDQLDQSDLPDLSDLTFLAALFVLLGLVGLLALLALVWVSDWGSRPMSSVS
jgi:hypothetical protein